MKIVEKAANKQQKIIVREYLRENPWKALEDKLGIEFCKQYMFMAEVEQDDKIIYLYKHSMTRRYLNLDSVGNFYYYCTGKIDARDYYEIADRIKSRELLEQHLYDCRTQWR